MTAIKVPDNYTNFQLPTLKFEHHPASSPTVTPIVIIKLNRPHAHHSYTEEMAANLVIAFDTLSADERVRSIIITSADTTNRFFCAGMDLNATDNRPLPVDTIRTHRDGGGTVSLAIHRCTKPVIAAMNGSAVGVGVTMTLPATIRVISNKAKVGLVFARRGFCMEACSSFYLPRLIGTSRAMHLVSTGAIYPANHRLLDGLFSEIVEPDQVLPTAIKIAEEISTNTSLVSLKVMKDMIYMGPQSPEEAHLLESKLFYDLFRSGDSKEGVKSFLEKREPKFTDTIAKNAPMGYPWWTPLDVRHKL